MQSRGSDFSPSVYFVALYCKSGAAAPGILSGYEKTSAPRRNCVRKIVSHRLNVASLTFSRWIAVRCVIVYGWDENRRDVRKTVQSELRVPNFSISFKIFSRMRLSNSEVKKITAILCIMHCGRNFTNVARKKTRTILGITIFI